MRTPHRIPRQTPRTRGTQLLEFAMVLPMLLMMFLGVFDFGWVLHQQIALDNATREGARRGAVGANNGSIIATMQNMVEFDLDPADVTISVVDASGNARPNTSRQPDETITVRIDREDIDLITPIRALVDTIGTINLASEARFIVE
jgi:Flp pilus assembly protein TadG